jgi:uncharacterized protein (TIGR03086 family)
VIALDRGTHAEEAGRTVDLTTMTQACTATDQTVERITPDQLHLPTPCSEWDVRALLNHVVGTLSLGAALLSDTAPTVAMGPGELPATDVLDGDPQKAYRTGVEALLAAAGGDALDRPHTTPLGDMPGTVLGGFTTLDIAVHGWDLAVATGQRPAIDDDLAEILLGFARQTITADTREPRIGPEIPAAAGASSTDRLAAFLGRRA